MPRYKVHNFSCWKYSGHEVVQAPTGIEAIVEVYSQRADFENRLPTKFRHLSGARVIFIPALFKTNKGCFLCKLGTSHRSLIKELGLKLSSREINMIRHYDLRPERTKDSVTLMPQKKFPGPETREPPPWIENNISRRSKQQRKLFQ